MSVYYRKAYFQEYREYKEDLALATSRRKRFMLPDLYYQYPGQNFYFTESYIK